MSDLPALAKSYTYTKINQGLATTGSATTTQQQFWVAIFASLLGMAGSAAWTCIGSSNSTAAALDGTNRLTTNSSIVTATGASAHSWIVLKQANMGGMQICFDFNASSTFFPLTINMWVSFAGFTGGSTTARPTATDEKEIGAGVGPTANADVSYRLHVFGSTDGKIAYVIAYTANTQALFLKFAQAQNVPTALTWTNPYLATAQWGTSCLNYSNMGNTASDWAYVGATPAWCSHYLTSECYGSSPIPTNQSFADDDSSEWPFVPIGYFSLTAAHRGRKGAAIDLWWGSSTVNSGDSYPASGTTFQFAQFGGLIFPWDSVTPPATS